MMEIFTPKTDKQKELSEIIMNNPSKSIRKAALKSLRKDVGDSYPIPALISKEYYNSITGKPSYFRRFRSATIFFDTRKLQLK